MSIRQNELNNFYMDLQIISALIIEMFLTMLSATMSMA